MNEGAGLPEFDPELSELTSDKFTDNGECGVSVSGECADGESMFKLGLGEGIGLSGDETCEANVVGLKGLDSCDEGTRGILLE